MCACAEHSSWQKCIPCFAALQRAFSKPHGLERAKVAVEKSRLSRLPATSVQARCTLAVESIASGACDQDDNDNDTCWMCHCSNNLANMSTMVGTISNTTQSQQHRTNLQHMLLYSLGHLLWLLQAAALKLLLQLPKCEASSARWQASPPHASCLREGIVPSQALQPWRRIALCNKWQRSLSSPASLNR